MYLSLSVTSFHRFTTNIEVNKFLDSKGTSSSLTIGRASQCGWCLPDPERVISGVHTKIKTDGLDFFIEDESTNGTFINRSVKPIGQGKSIKLSHGDLISIGDYEVKVEIVPAEVPNVSAEPHECFNNKQVSYKEETSEQGFGIPVDALLNDSFSLPKEKDQPEAIPQDWHALIAQEEGITGDAVPSTHRVPPHSHAPVEQKTPPRHGIEQDGEPMAAFLDGLGISSRHISQENPALWWHQLGVVTRDLLDGVMTSLHNRSAFKESSRINQTTFQRTENNPLKFSANAEDAIYNMLQRKTAGFLSPDQAVKQAFADLESHDKAMLVGVKGAVSGVLDTLSPHAMDSINNQTSQVSNSLPIFGRNKLWKNYCQTHQKLSADINNSSDFYMEDFSKAYEERLRECE